MAASSRLPGSDEQSFKVAVTSNAQYAFLHYLEVREFVESEEKPFFYRGTFGIRTGTCRHL